MSLLWRDRGWEEEEEERKLPGMRENSLEDTEEGLTHMHKNTHIFAHRHFNTSTQQLDKNGKLAAVYGFPNCLACCYPIKMTITINVSFTALCSSTDEEVLS